MNLSRHMGTLDLTSINPSILIIGAGGIGSWTTLSLAKLGFKDITVVDFDVVDDVNIPSQVYGLSQIGVPKTIALGSLVNFLTGTNIDSHVASYPVHAVSSRKYDFVIVAVDSMDVRKQIAQDVRLRKLITDRVFDARMSIETGGLYSYDVDGAEKYESTLYTNEEAVQEACSNKAICYTTQMIGALIAKAVCQYITHNKLMRFQFDLKSDGMPEIVITHKEIV